MDDASAALAAAIGARVKHQRHGRRWTLDQLADAASVSRRMLVNVEQGSVNPSVGTLLRLSDALGVGLPALVEPPKPATIRVVRAGSGAVLWSSRAGGRGVLLAGTEPPDVVELWDWTLPAGDRYVSEPHAVGTRELVHIIKGRLEIAVDDRRVTLAAGDAAMFRGDTEHSYTNAGRGTVRFSLAVYEPGVGTATATHR